MQDSQGCRPSNPFQPGSSRHLQLRRLHDETFFNFSQLESSTSTHAAPSGRRRLSGQRKDQPGSRSRIRDPCLRAPNASSVLRRLQEAWRDAKEKGYDRVSGNGYYRNAPDFESARNLLLKPAGPLGSGSVVLCGHDPITGIDHRDITVEAPDDTVLIVDSVFAMRPEYDEFWDVRIWIDVAPELSLARGIARDEATEGRDEPQRLDRERYHESERIYIDVVDPKSKANIIIDNTDFAAPVLLRH